MMGTLFVFYLYAVVRSNMLFRKAYKNNCKVAEEELAALNPSNE